MTGNSEARLPGELAVASFGHGMFARVIQEVRSAEWSVILLATNEEPDVLPYEIVFHHAGNRWTEMMGSDSPGWRRAGDGNGFVTAWGETETDSPHVAISYRGVTITRPVTDSYYLGVFWDIPEDEFDPDAPPEVTGPG